MNVRDKVVIITGASMGIGEATARVFAEAGAKLVLAARSADKLQTVAQSLPCETLTVSSPRYGAITRSAKSAYPACDACSSKHTRW